MRWKTVALAGAVVPTLGGCSILENTTRNAINEPHLVTSLLSLEYDLRKQAKEAWQQVRAEYPRRAFTAEFRDGFLDGYVDYLDRGGNGSLPAVPPAKYIRQKKYFTEEGHCLLKDYFLGFKYGQEIAIATGKRQFLTVPVLLPQEPTGPPAFQVAASPPPTASAPPRQAELPRPRPIPKSDAPPTKTTESKDRSATEQLPGRLPVPQPLLPVVRPLPETPVAPGVPTPGSGPVPGGVPVPGGGPVPPAAPSEPKLPPPPVEVPELPPEVPTPSVLDELPVVLPSHTIPPPPLPVHPEK